MRIALVSAVIRLTVFWWLLTAAVSFWNAGSQGWQNIVPMLGLTAIGALAGVIMVWTSTVSYRASRSRMVDNDEVRGLTCSIGEIPFLIQPPLEATDLPQLIDWPDVPEAFFAQWRNRYLSSHPHHMALFDRLLKIYNHNPDLPATHVPGGHGGRTLLQHALLCAYLMYSLGENWVYKGLAARTDNKRVILALRDPDYQYDCNDPLAVIIGLAHDLGKIEAYRYNKEGKVVGIRNEHDLTGARILARLDELWALPDIDRSAILLAIAHYHHPVELPLHSDRGAIDDRTIALMELLIKTDNNAGYIEHSGRRLTEAEYDNLHDEVDGQEDIPVERMWEVFCDMVHEPNAINQKARSGIALYMMGGGLNAPHLFLNSKDMAGLLEVQLGVAGKILGDGRHSHVVRLMEALAEKNVLLTKIKIKSGQQDEAVVEMPAHSAIWDVDFMEKDSQTGGFKKKTGWNCLVIDIRRNTALQELDKKIKAHKWVAYFKRPTMGAGRAKKNGVSQDDIVNEEAEVFGDSGPDRGAQGDLSNQVISGGDPPALVLQELPEAKTDDRASAPKPFQDVDYGAETAKNTAAKKAAQKLIQTAQSNAAQGVQPQPELTQAGALEQLTHETSQSMPPASTSAAQVAPITVGASTFMSLYLPTLLRRASEERTPIDQVQINGTSYWIFPRDVCAHLIPDLHWKGMRREFKDAQEKGTMPGCLLNDPNSAESGIEYSLLLDVNLFSAHANEIQLRHSIQV